MTAASCLCVREYEFLKQHILTDLLSTALGWPATAQDQGRGGGRPLEDAGSFTARERGRSASEVGTGRVREVGSSTPASVLHAKSKTLEPTVAVEPAQHGAKVDGGSRRPPAFAAEPLEPISCSPTAFGVTVAVQSHVQVQARMDMARGKQQEASKPLATSPWSAAATRCGAKGVKTRPLARGRTRGGRRPPSAVHASSGWGRSIPADRLATAGAQRTVWEQPPSTERVHLGQGDISSLFPVSPEVLERNARWATAFGWSRPLHVFLPWEGAAPEAGSASEPPGTPVVDVPTQPPFLLGTALDLHGDAETLKISVQIQTPGPAPALTPSPVEEKEKIIAMPVAGRRSSDTVRVASATCPRPEVRVTAEAP